MSRFSCPSGPYGPESRLGTPAGYAGSLGKRSVSALAGKRGQRRGSAQIGLIDGGTSLMDKVLAR